MNHCACHKSSLSAADGAGVPELAVFDHQVKSFYNFFGHSVIRRTMHSHVQQRMQETVRHLKKGIVTVSAGGPIFCICGRPDFSMTVYAGGPIFCFVVLLSSSSSFLYSAEAGVGGAAVYSRVGRGPRELGRGAPRIREPFSAM
jgi:hypothetical protein